MGRQINYFMTAEDEKVFLDYVGSTCNLAILPYRSKTPVFSPIDRLPTPESDSFWLSLYFLNQDVSHKVVTHFIPEQDHYYVDEDESDVVEFSRSVLVDDSIPRGRIYVQLYSHFDEDTGRWVKKDQELARWFERLVRWIRKNFRKGDWYIGPDAQALLDSGDFVYGPQDSIHRVPKEDS